ncbi:MAG: hypothetical protein WAT39_09330 [Planctomycetota bacterium]
MFLTARTLTAIAASALAPLLAGQAAAPAPSNGDVALLANHLVAGPDWREVGTMPGSGWEMRPQRRADGTVAVGNSVADPLARVVLEPYAGQLRLSHLDRGLLWQRPLDELCLHHDPAQVANALLGQQCVIVVGPGGFVALDRSSGATRWEKAVGTGDQRLIDGDLLITLGRVDKDVELRAWALGNGAQAFAVRTRPGSTRMVAAPHGIAVSDGATCTVWDRSGPRLFELALATSDVAAHPGGWYLLTADTLLAVDRTGTPLWQRAVALPHFERGTLATDRAGRCVLTAFMPRSDSGARVTVHDPVDGGVVFGCELAGLGIAHSKYWHDVRTFAGNRGLVVTSHDAGGQWLAELGGDDGRQLARVQFPR